MNQRLYPAELEEDVTLPSGRVVTLRPIRPEDEAQHLDLLHNLSLEDSRWRFFVTIKDMGHDEISRFTCIDYDADMAFIAVYRPPNEAPKTLGVVRAAILSGAQEAEFAIVVRTGDKSQGLGWALMQKMLNYLKAHGISRVVGEVLPDNRDMLVFARDLGFESRFSAADGVTKIWKTLT